jgi:formate hydrogenlyase subunit 3/multisubunit Na+/H+ antiporter MnhD subunit
MANPLFLLVAVPLGIGIINLLLPTIAKKAATLLGILFCAILVARLFGDSPGSGELFGVTVSSLDKTSLLIVALIQLLGLIILIFSLFGVGKDIEGRFFILYSLTIAFSNGVVVSEHALAFLIFWSLTGLTLYGFALLGGGKEAPATAKKTFILVGGSDTFLLFGLALMWLKTQGSWSLRNPAIPVQDGAAAAAFVFLLIAALAKAGGFPFHTWVPDFCREAPVESAALLPAALDKLLGVYLLARIMTTYFKGGLSIQVVAITLGALSVVTGVMMAMIQHNGRRLLGYHAVSQVGYMIIGVGSGTALGFAGGLFHLINNTLYKSSLLLSMGSVEKRTGSHDLDDLGGLGKMMPVTFLVALIGSLSIAGIPPFNGFFSKWMIYQGLFEKTADPGLSKGLQIWLLVCLILAVFGSALTLASFMKFLHSAFLGKRPQRLDSIREAPFNQWLAGGLLAALCVACGVFARELPLRRLIAPAVDEAGLAPSAALGFYNPQVVFVLFAVAFLLGLAVYFVNRRIRFDDVYLGGQSPAEHFRIIGTEFFNEIRSLKPLKTAYDWAEKKYFDVYDLGAKATFGFSRWLQEAHTGLLPLYLVFVLVGLLVLLSLSLRS